MKSLEEIPELLKETPPENKYEEVKEQAEKIADIRDDVKDLEIKDNAIIEPEPVEEVTNVNNCEYRLTLQFNNETYDCFTNNLKIGILSFAREVLTEMFIKIEKGQAVFEKKLNLTQAKMLFNDMQSLEIFLETFYGLYGRPTSKQLM